MKHKARSSLKLQLEYRTVKTDQERVLKQFPKGNVGKQKIKVKNGCINCVETR